MLCREIDRAFPGKSIEPKVIVGKVVEGVAPYCSTHSAELGVNGLVVADPMELMQPASELADATLIDFCSYFVLTMPRWCFPLGQTRFQS